MNLFQRLSTFSPLTSVFSPLLSFLTACSRLGKWVNGVTFTLFYAFFGYAHSFLDTRPDGYRKMLAFTSFPETTTCGDVIRLYSDGYISDVIEQLLYIFVKTFTSDAHVLLLVVGGIGGGILYLCIRKIIEYCKTDEGIEFYAVVFTTIVLHSPLGIGGIRFFIGFPLFLYGTILFLIERRSIGFLFLLISLLSHFSFIALVAFVCLLRIYSGNEKWLWWATVTLCIVSVFLSATSYEGLFSNMNLEDYNQKIANRSLMYSSEKSVEHFSTSLTTHLMKVQQYLTQLFVLFSLFAIKRNGLHYEMKEFDLHLYRITLALLAFGFFFVSFNVVGERLLRPGIILLLVLLFRLHFESEIEILGRLLRYSVLFFVFNLGWVVYNTYIVLDLRYLVYPLPLFMIL